MKKLVLIVAFLLACNFRLSATEKNDIIKEIWDYYEKTINSAKYTNSKSEVGVQCIVLQVGNVKQC